MTMAQLEYSRDVSIRWSMPGWTAMIKALQAYGAQNAENKRVAGDDLLSAQNSYKAYTGFLSGLRDPQLMARKRDEEQTLRRRVERRSGKAQEVRQGLGRSGRAPTEGYATFSKPYIADHALFSELFGIARQRAALAEEMQKPSDQRLREYRDSALPSLEQELYSTAPISPIRSKSPMLAENFRFMRVSSGSAITCWSRSSGRQDAGAGRRRCM